MKLVLYVPVAADPGGQGGRVGVAAGDEVDDLDGLLALPGDRAADLGDLGGAGELDPGGCERGLDGAADPAAVVRAHGRYGGDGSPGQLPELPVQGRHVALDGHHVVRVAGEDGLRGVVLRVQRVLCRHLRYADLRRDMSAVCLVADHEIDIIIAFKDEGDE